MERHVRLCQACVAAACRDNDYPTFSSSLPFFNLGIIYITILRFEKITLLAWIGMGDQSPSCAAHCALNWNSEKFGVFLDHHNNELTGKTLLIPVGGLLSVQDPIWTKSWASQTPV